MVGGRLPDLPNLGSGAKMLAEGIKGLAEGSAKAGEDLVGGVEEILLGTGEEFAEILNNIGNNAAKGAIKLIRRDLKAGKVTMEQIRGDVTKAIDSAVRGVDQAVGREIIEKFKSEIERQLRKF